MPAHDCLGVWVFTAALSPEDLRRDKAALAHELLGDAHLDPTFVEIFDLSDLAGVGLSGYLIDGLGIPEAAVSDRAHPDAMKGPVLILLSKALHGREMTLTPDPRLTLVGTYAEDRPPVHFEPLPNAAAKGQLTPDPTRGRTRLPLGMMILLLGFEFVVVATVALLLVLR